MNESEVKRQLELLDLMNQAELREKFCDLFGFEPGQTNIANLRRRLACRIQEIYYGGLSEADRQLLEQIADGDPPGKSPGMEKMEFPMCAELATRGSGKVKNMK